MKVLAVHTSHIGDMVSGTGVMRFLRERFGLLHVLTDLRWAPVLEGEPGLVVHTPESAREERFELLLDFSSTKKSLREVCRIRADRKVCLCDSTLKRLSAIPFYQIRLHRGDRHIVRTYSPFLRYFGEEREFLPLLTDNRNERALRFLAELRAEGYASVAGIHFDAASERRFLPEELVTETVRHLQSRGAAALLLGTDRERALRLSAASGGYARYATFILSELKTVLAGLDCFIGTDSGLLHIAAALGTPTAGIYGPNIPAVSGPLAPGIHFLEIPLDCRPCNQNRKCPRNVSCLRDIPGAAITRAIDSILDSRH